MFSFVRSYHTDYFQSGYFVSHFSFLLSVKKSSCCSVSLLAFGVVSCRILAILIGCNGISFSNSIGCWVPFHMINYDLCIFLGEVSVSLPILKLDSLFSYCWILSVLYIFLSTLSDLSFENIFSQSVTCLFIHLIVSFIEQEVQLNYFSFMEFAFGDISKSSSPNMIIMQAFSCVTF